MTGRRRGVWLACALVCACTKPAAAPTSTPPEVARPAPSEPWSPVRSEAGSFSIDMPPGVEARRAAIADAEGRAASYSFQSLQGEAFYAVFVKVYAGRRRLDPAAVLDAAQQRAMSNIGGTLVSATATTLAGHDARAIALHLVGDGLALEAHARLALIDDRVYELVVVTPRGKAPAADMQRFFASFELLAPASPPVAGGDAVRSVIRAHTNEIRRCMAFASAATDTEVTGRIVMNFTIGPDGAVTASRVEETTLPDEMSPCMLEVIDALQFPRPHDGKPIVVSYPFVIER